MSHRRRHASTDRDSRQPYVPVRPERDAEPQRYAWLVYAVAMLLVGGLAGYVLSVAGSQRVAPGGSPAPVPAATSAPAVAGPGAGLVDDVALRTFRDILARDPKNVQAAVGAGNLLYDAKRYEEAIPFYQQALASGGTDANVSTDLGTALWYTGRADAALAQYAVSLSLQPNHPQTLFNLGIVRSDGKKDYAGAVQAWETLLATTPAYVDAGRVRTLIAEARTKLAAPTI